MYDDVPGTCPTGDSFPLWPGMPTTSGACCCCCSAAHAAVAVTAAVVPAALVPPPPPCGAVVCGCCCCCSSFSYVFVGLSKEIEGGVLTYLFPLVIILGEEDL